jgi:hypothetical protein
MWMMLPEALSQLTAPDFRHGQVGEHGVQMKVLGSDQLQGLLAVGRLQHLKPSLRERAPGHGANQWIVFDQQNPPAARASRHFLGGLSSYGGDRLRHRREVELESGAEPRFAVRPDVPAALLHDAVHHGQPQSTSFAHGLGGEERLE